MLIRLKSHKDTSEVCGCTPARWRANQGQSIIEVIVAVAVLVIIAGSSVIAILGSFSTTRLAKEETQATLFATEGLEAVQSIRNQGWDDPFLATDCSALTCGLSKTGNLWSFSETSDDPDGSGKFTRTIAIADVERDGDGNIVESGGAVDEETKKITSAVTWDFTPARSNTVDMVAYLTNWQTGKGPVVIPTPTPTPEPEYDSCDDYCQQTYSLSGSCVKSKDCGGYDEGRIYECSSPNICCCE